MSEKAIAQLRTYVSEILKERIGDEQAKQLAEKLATGTWTHDYPLTYEEVKQLGLPVSTDMPEDVYSYMDLFPQQKQRVPSVQYLPVPARQRENQSQ